MKLALDMGVKKLSLEGDSNNIIRCIKGVIQPTWTIAHIIEEIHTSLGNFDSIHVSHDYKEANSVADWFANEAVKQEKVMIWNTGEDTPKNVKSLIKLKKIQGGLRDI